MKEKIIAELGANYNINDEEVLEGIIKDIVAIATEISNLPYNDMRLYPYIARAVKSEYLARGAEGLKSRSEGSISSSYENITERLRNDIVKGGLRRCY